jgi:outer membrane protein
MVRKLSTVLIAVAALAAGPGALAAELSIAVVDVQAAIGQTQEAQVFLERVQGELQADQERIRELQAEKTRIEERVERDSEVMSEEERVRLSEEYDRITSDLQYRAETYQKAVNRRRNELFRQMGPRVEAALDDLVQREGYDLVVPRNSVIYANPRHDITRRLTEQLDAKD